MRIRIIKKGIPLTQIPIKFRKRINLTKEQVKLLGIETQAKFKELIRLSKKRPGGGNLESLIEVEYFVDGVSWGVGNIALLNKEAPYWKAFNWGRKMAGTQVKGGIFSPGNPKPDKSFFRQGRWQKGQRGADGKWYGFTAKRDIQPTNFLERTIWWFKRRILTLTKGLNK